MKSNLKKLTALVCIAAMLTTGTPAVSAAAPSPQVLVPASDFPTDLASLTIPETLGTLEEAFLTGGNRTVILIQDAHAVPDAQNNIRKLIHYFQNEYGVGAVAVEGAAGPLDTFFLRQFPDDALLKKTMRAYHERAEFSGTSAAALFDTGSHSYYGIEDWPLYEEGIKLYQKAAEKEASLLSRIGSERAAVQQQKETVYSAELLAFDTQLMRYREQGGNLVEILKSAARLTSALQGSALEALISQINAAEAAEEMLQRQTRQALQMFRQNLTAHSKTLPASLNSAIQAFETEAMPAAEFALILKKTAKKESLRISFGPELARQVRMQNKLQQIKGTKLYEDLQAYLQEAKGALMTTAEQRVLDGGSQQLDLREKLARLELTREEWEELKAQSGQRIESGNNKGAQKHLSARRLPLDASYLFYENAEKREGAFLGQLHKLLDESPAHPMPARRDKTNSRVSAKAGSTVILVAGGFHSHGLARRLRDENIRYLLLTPKIKDLPEKSVYREQMMGAVSWKKYFRVVKGRVNLRDAFLRAVRDDLLAYSVQRLASRENQTEDLYAKRSTLKLWRDAIIRGLADEHRLGEAGSYTRFLDELHETSGPGSTLDAKRSTFLSRLTRFIDGLKQLESTRQLTEKNIFKLLRSNAAVPALSAHTAQVPAVGGAFANVSVPADYVRGLAGRLTKRSEVRSPEAANLLEQLLKGQVVFSAETPMRGNYWDEEDEETIATYRDAFVARTVVRDYFEVILGKKELFYQHMGDLAHELMTNIFDHGKSGELEVQKVIIGDETFYDFTSIDHGSGIENPEISAEASKIGSSRGHGFRLFNEISSIVAIEIFSRGKHWVRNTEKTFELAGDSEVTEGSRIYIRVRYPGKQLPKRGVESDAQGRSEVRTRGVEKGAKEEALISTKPSIRVLGGASDRGPGASSYILTVGGKNYLLDDGKEAEEDLRKSSPSLTDQEPLNKSRSEMRTHALSELDIEPQYQQILAGFRKVHIPEAEINRMASVIVEILEHQPPFVLRQGKPLLNLFRIFDPALDGRVAEFVSTTGTVYALLSEAFLKKAKDFYGHDNLTALYFASQVAAMRNQSGALRYDLLSIGHKIKSEEAGGAVPDAILYDRELEIYLIGEFRAGYGDIARLLQQKREQTLHYLRLLLNADLGASVFSDETILPQHVLGKNPAGLVWVVDRSFAKGDEGEGWSVQADARNRLRALVEEAKAGLVRDGIKIRNDFDLDHIWVEFVDQLKLYAGPGTVPFQKNTQAISVENWQKAATVLDSLYERPGFAGYSGLRNPDLYGLAKDLGWHRPDGGEMSLEEIYYRYLALGATLNDRLSAISKLRSSTDLAAREELELPMQRVMESLNQALSHRWAGGFTETLKDVLLMTLLLKKNNPEGYSDSDQHQLINHFIRLVSALQEPNRGERDRLVRGAVEFINVVFKRQGKMLFYSSLPASEGESFFHLLDWDALQQQANDIANQLTLRVPGQLKSILVAEDLLISEYEFWAKELQEKWGVELVVKPNGREGLDELTQNGARYDLIISDVNMPEMTGPGMMNAFSDLLHQQHDTPAIYVTDVNIEALQPQRDIARDYAYPPVQNWTNRAHLEKPAAYFDAYTLPVLSEVINLLRARDSVQRLAFSGQTQADQASGRRSEVRTDGKGDEVNSKAPAKDELEQKKLAFLNSRRFRAFGSLWDMFKDLGVEKGDQVLAVGIGVDFAPLVALALQGASVDSVQPDLYKGGIKQNELTNDLLSFKQAELMTELGLDIAPLIDTSKVGYIPDEVTLPEKNYDFVFLPWVLDDPYATPYGTKDALMPAVIQAMKDSGTVIFSGSRLAIQNGMEAYVVEQLKNAGFTAENTRVFKQVHTNWDDAGDTFYAIRFKRQIVPGTDAIDSATLSLNVSGAILETVEQKLKLRSEVRAQESVQRLVSSGRGGQEERDTSRQLAEAAAAAKRLVSALETGDVTRSEVRTAVSITVQLGAAPVVAELQRIYDELAAQELRGETILIAGKEVNAELVHTKVQAMLEQLRPESDDERTAEGHAVTYFVPVDLTGAKTLERVLARFAPDLKQVLFKKTAESLMQGTFFDRLKKLGIKFGFITDFKKSPTFWTDQTFTGLVGLESAVPQEGLSEVFIPVVQLADGQAQTDPLPLIQELELAMQTAIALLVAKKIKKTSDRMLMRAQAIALLKSYDLFPGFESDIILARNGGIAISGAAMESFLADWAVRQQTQTAA